MEKTKRHFYLPESDVEWLESYRKENQLSNLSAALSRLIQESRDRQPGDTQKQMIHMLAAQITAEITPALTRILAASNRIDKVTTINQILLNSLSGYSDFRTLYEADSPQLTRAEELWQLRKEELRQKAIDRSKKKQTGGES